MVLITADVAAQAGDATIRVGVQALDPTEVYQEQRSIRRALAAETSKRADRARLPEDSYGELPS